MKRLAIIAIVAVILGGIAVWFNSDSVEYIQGETQIVEKEVDVLEKAIVEAQEAKKVEIEATAQKAWQDAYDQEMKKVELEVLRSFGEKLDTRQTELEKETQQY
jgi:FKBP-type peptidyl-prolyl cis-trans isomerase 2